MIDKDKKKEAGHRSGHLEESPSSGISIGRTLLKEKSQQKKALKKQPPTAQIFRKVKKQPRRSVPPEKIQTPLVSASVESPSVEQSVSRETAGEKPSVKPEISSAPSDTAAEITGAFDALVVMAQNDSQTLGERAERLYKNWTRVPGISIGLTSLGVSIEGHNSLLETSTQSAWSKLSWLAGLRKIAITEYARPENFVVLAEKLASTNETIESITQLADWLWCNGAAGFKLELGNAYTDAFRVNPALGDSAYLSIAEGAGDYSLKPLATGMTSAYRLPEQFDAPFNSYLSHCTASTSSTMQEGRNPLLNRFESGSLNLVVEYDLLLNEEGYQKVLSSRQVAALIVYQLKHDKVMSAFKYIIWLSSRGGEAGEAVLKELEDTELWSHVSAVIRVDGKTLELLIASLMQVSAHVIGQLFIRGLLLRVEKEPAIFQVLGEQMAKVSLRRFCQWLEVEGLTSSEIKGLATLSDKVFHECGDLSQVIQKVSDEKAVIVVEALNPAHLIQIKAAVGELLNRVKGELASRVVDSIIETNSRECIRLLAISLIENHGKSWPEIAARNACDAVVEFDLAAKYFLPLVRSRKADTEFRLMVMDALEDDAELLNEATRWRPSEVIDVSAVRQRIQEIRRGEGNNDG